MEVDFIPEGVYEDIIQHVGKWKIMDIKRLQNHCNYNVGYFNLLKKIRKLETTGFLKSKKFGGKDKHVYLTRKGLELTKQGYSFEICTDNLTHDIITSNVLKTFLELDTFHDGQMYHELPIDNLLPDASVKGCKSGHEYHLSLEVELTRKSDDRVKEKFVKYSQNTNFDYILYITNKENIFKAYKHLLEKMMPKVQEIIMIMLEPSLTVTTFNPKKSQIWFQNNLLSFDEIFGK